MNTPGYDHAHGLDCDCRFPTRDAESVAPEARHAIASYLALALNHAVVSTDPLTFGGNTLAMAENLRKVLMENGLVIVRWADWIALNDGGGCG